MPRKSEKAKTEKEQKEEMLEAREGATSEFLTEFEQIQKDSLDRENDAVSKMPDGPQKYSKQKRIGFLQKDIEESGASLKSLSDDRDVSSGVTLAGKIIARRTKNYKYADGLKVSKYIEQTVDNAAQKAENGTFVLELKEAELFLKYLEIFQGKRKKDVEGLKKKILELKAKLPQPENEPPEESKNKKTTMAIDTEANKNKGEEDAENLEELSSSEDPFRAYENETVQSLTERYAQGAEVSDESKKVIDGFLAQDAQEGYRMFALAYFEDHKKDIQKEKGVPIENVSDEWKINMVLSSKENGGMGVSAEIKEGKYKWIGDEIDKITVLRTDMKKEPIPPKTPFLLLNYLQKSVKGERKKIEKLKERAEKGDESAGVEAAFMESQLEELFLAQKEIVEKAMGENLEEDAEKKLALDGFPSKDEHLKTINSDGKSHLDATVEAMKNNDSELFMAREWAEFQKLTDRQKIAFRNRLGRGVVDKKLNPMHNITSEADLKKLLFSVAKENRVNNEDAFNGMLQQGYKPYSAREVGPLSIWPLSIFFRAPLEIQTISGGVERMSDEGYIELIRKSEENYREGIEGMAKSRLEKAWDEEHSKQIRLEIDNRINELAKTPGAAIGGVEKIYRNARERIMAEYERERAEKNPKTAEQVEILKEKLSEGGRKVDINTVLSDVLPNADNERKGKFAKLLNWGKKENNINFGIIKKYLSDDLGVDVDADDIKRVVTEDKYNKMLKKKAGLFHLLLEIVENVHNAATGKRKVKKKK